MTYEKTPKESLPRQLRKLEQLTITELAEQTGLSRPTILKIERGEEIQLASFVKWCKYFEVRPDEAVRLGVKVKNLSWLLADV